jgi:hypothetical protein
MSVFEKMEAKNLKRLIVLPDNPGMEEATFLAVKMKEDGFAEP